MTTSTDNELLAAQENHLLDERRGLDRDLRAIDTRLAGDISAVDTEAENARREELSARLQGVERKLGNVREAKLDAIRAEGGVPGTLTEQVRDLAARVETLAEGFVSMHKLLVLRHKHADTEREADLARGESVVGLLQTLLGRIETLEQHGTSAMTFCGPWQPTVEAQAGQVFTHAGAVWCARAGTTTPPAADDLTWGLVLPARK